ncbi:hypothetical protein [Arthrobacter monumenti]
MNQESGKKVDDDGATDSKGTKDSGGTIPNPKDGVGATSTDEANTFEEEEDPEHGPDDAKDRRDGDGGS